MSTLRTRLSFLMAALVGSLMLAAAEGQTVSKDCGWCVITAPAVVSPTEPFDIKVQVKAITVKTKLSADLH